jgi:5-methylcytosine-specific restriction enzyme A
MPKRPPTLKPFPIRTQDAERSDRAAQVTAKSRHDATRPTAAQRGYGHAWRKTREQVLSEEPLCRRCSEAGKVVAATDVDHEVPKRRGGTEDRSNLVPLCHACHSAKTCREDGGLGLSAAG